MKKIFIVILLAFALGATITSCTSSKVGCRTTMGMVGYQ